jgi:hypothetical protein
MPMRSKSKALQVFYLFWNGMLDDRGPSVLSRQEWYA